jgi:PelA/Pel-15E family pectate lyase
MMKNAIAALLTILLAPPAFGASQPQRQEIERALERAVRYFASDVATHGGYLWTYSPDLTERAGEGKATPTQIWVQPPGTPSVGMALLDAYRATGGRLCLDAATSAARALVWGQLACGGWDYKIDFDPRAERRWRYYHNETTDKPRGQRNTGTFDDDNSQSALRFLMAVDRATSDPDVHAAVDRAIAFFLEAQFPNGAWPQRYPLASGGYSRFYTFNDNTHNDCIATMWQAWKTYGRADCRDSALRGGRFIIESQLDPPQAGWAQQYDHELRPAPARWFEPAACCSAATIRNIRTLTDLYLWTGDESFLKPIPPAIDWLERSALRPGVWARFYEPKTNRPIYVTVDKKVVYEQKNLRPGYGWFGDFGGEAAIARYRDVVSKGRQAYLEAQRRPPTENERARDRVRLGRRAQTVADALDSQGRWIVNDQISTRTFIRNVRALSEYLAQLSP